MVKGSAVTGRIVLEYSSEYVALFLFSDGCQPELLVGLVYVHRSLVYKYPPGELLQTSEVSVLSLKSLAMDILACEVEHPRA
jgi:hypothetical protein